MRFEVRLTDDDIAQKRMSGRVTYRVRTRDAGTRFVLLNAVGLVVQSVRALPDERPLRFVLAPQWLAIDLGGELAAGAERELQIAYEVKNPPKGLYFVLPDDDHPARPRTVYTMSEPLTARYWVPCHDWPDTRWTSDILVTVPEPLSAVAIGAPEGEPQDAGDGLRTYHWQQRVPTDPHMMGFAVSEFVTVVNSSAVPPVLAYVQPGWEAEAHFTFRRVPDMLAFYSKLLGVAYPYEQYAHVAVIDHFHGGMEHAGFSMITPSALTASERGHVPQTWFHYNYVAHMLAHQWFGGIVNYCDVREAWLNESFGTYLHLNWYVANDSSDAFDEQMWETGRGAARSDVAGRDRPLLRDDLRDADDVYGFDGAKVYWKGAWVLHMLRHQLGDETFWRATRTYLERFRGGCARTSDLEATFTEVAGQNLRPFFDQWVRRAGLPRVRVTYAWEPGRRAATVTITQQQRIDADHPAYQFPLDLWFRAQNVWHNHTVNVTESETSVEFTLPGEPELVCADPRGGLLAPRKEDKPQALWLRQAREGPTALSRLQAIEHLRAQKSADALPVLASALADEKEYWGVRRRAASALGQLESDAAREALVAAIKSGLERPELMAAVLEALGHWPSSEEAYRVVARCARAERHIVPQEAAVRTLARFHRDVQVPEFVEFLARLALPPTSRFVRSAAADALLRIGDARALDVLIAEAKADPNDVLEHRQEVVHLVAQLARDEPGRRSTAVAYLFAQLDDPRPAVRAAAVRELGSLGDHEVIPRLRELTEQEPATVRTAADEAIEEIERRVSGEAP